MLNLKNRTVKLICAGMTTAMLMTGMTAMAFADESNAKDKVESFKISYSISVKDDGQDLEGAEGNIITIDGAMETIQFKLDEKTGKYLFSKDGGETWEQAGEATWKPAEACSFDLQPLSKEDLEQLMNDGLDGTAFKSISLSVPAKSIELKDAEQKDDRF